MNENENFKREIIDIFEKQISPSIAKIFKRIEYNGEQILALNTMYHRHEDEIKDLNLKVSEIRFIKTEISRIESNIKSFDDSFRSDFSRIFDHLNNADIALKGLNCDINYIKSSLEKKETKIEKNSLESNSIWKWLLALAVSIILVLIGSYMSVF